MSALLLQAAGCSVGSVQFNPACFLSIPPTIWFPIFLAIISVAISVIVVIYALSPLLGRNDIKVWSKIKIYEILLTVLLAVFFLALSSFLYTVNPAPVLSSIGLLPSTCNPMISNTPSSSNVNNLYGIAVCDMYQYNQHVASFSSGVFYMAMIAGIAPTANFNAVALVGGIPDLPSSGAGGAASPGLGVSFLVNFVPIQFVFQYLVPLMSAYFAVVILAQMQQILLSASMLLFSVFMIMGFVARAFTVTRTFGGSMIAFALGIGFIYPLVTLMSYGFLDVAIANVPNAVCVPGACFQGSFTTLMSAILKGLFGAVVTAATSNCSNPAAAACQNTALSTAITPLVIYGGFVSAGLMLLPLLNLIIVDAFIVDVSRTIGERIDLMSLLTRIA